MPLVPALPGMLNLKKRIAKSITKWQKIASKVNELNYWIVVEGRPMNTIRVG
jgi:hypothetical protein